MSRTVCKKLCSEKKKLFEFKWSKSNSLRCENFMTKATCCKVSGARDASSWFAAPKPVSLPLYQCHMITNSTLNFMFRCNKLDWWALAQAKREKEKCNDAILCSTCRGLMWIWLNSGSCVKEIAEQLRWTSHRKAEETWWNPFLMFAKQGEADGSVKVN